jgi:hypothetical protein
MVHILISLLSWPILISVKLSKLISWSSSFSSHVPLSLGLLVSKKYQHWRYVSLSTLPIWSYACPSFCSWTVLTILNEPHESQSSSCVISSILYILYPSWKQNNVTYFWIINKISHYFSSYSISDTEIWDVMHPDNGKRHWSESKSYIYMQEVW